MSGRNLFLFLTLIVIFLSALAGSTFAAEKPTFMSCVNPTGEVISSYNDGVHGVAGDTNTYVGKDTVYSSANGTTTQCLCEANGAGIQTNWMNASNLTEDEISIFINEGWILIPDGSVWGLSEGPFLAQNISYSCNGGSGGTSSSNSSSNENKVGGANAVNNILSLANTGNIIFIISIFVLGIALLLAGFATTLKRKA